MTTIDDAAAEPTTAIDPAALEAYIGHDAAQATAVANGDLTRKLTVDVHRSALTPLCLENDAALDETYDEARVVSRASLDALGTMPGMPQSVARAVYDYFHPTPEGEDEAARLAQAINVPIASA